MVTCTPSRMTKLASARTESRLQGSPMFEDLSTEEKFQTMEIVTYVLENYSDLHGLSDKEFKAHLLSGKAEDCKPSKSRFDSYMGLQ